jgi:hypothetical protein
MDTKNIGITAFVAFIIFSAVMYYKVFPPAVENGGEEDNDSETAWIFTLKVNGDSVGVYNVSQLSEMAHPLNITSHGESLIIQAAPISSMLDEHNIDIKSITTFKPLALDGYSIEINGTYIQNAHIRIVEQENIATNGALRLVVTELSSSQWVKYLVEIDLEV